MLSYGIVSASIAAALTTCIDVVKINLQLSDEVKSGTRLAWELLRTRGLAFMFKGASARVLYLAPRTGISYSTYDVVKRWWTTRNAPPGSGQQ